jgi:hypothetical protein
MAKLNAQSKVILQAKRQKKFMKNAPISLAFVGDSHIGKPNCKCGKDCAQKRYKELLRKMRDMKKVYAIVHGGDLVVYGDGLLKTFVKDTRSVLHYGSKTINKEDLTPLLANIGNHDYKMHKAPGTGVEIKDYRNLIGNDNDVVKLCGSAKGPRIAVVLLNTGFTNAGKMPSGMKFKDELDALEKIMGTLIKEHNDVRFIIDMHIPPHIPHVLFGTHVLNTQFNDQFRRFLIKHRSHILAVVAHHKHGQIQKKAYLYDLKHKNFVIPVYVTAQGGQCDLNAQPKSAQYSFYRIDLKKKGNPYSIDAVYRYDMVYDQTKKAFVLKRALIK